jgi:hypothetical protein
MSDGIVPVANWTSCEVPGVLHYRTTPFVCSGTSYSWLGSALCCDLKLIQWKRYQDNAEWGEVVTHDLWCSGILKYVWGSLAAHVLLAAVNEITRAETSATSLSVFGVCCFSENKFSWHLVRDFKSFSSMGIKTNMKIYERKKALSNTVE